MGTRCPLQRPTQPAATLRARGKAFRIQSGPNLQRGSIKSTKARHYGGSRHWPLPIQAPRPLEPRSFAVRMPKGENRGLISLPRNARAERRQLCPTAMAGYLRAWELESLTTAAVEYFCVGWREEGYLLLRSDTLWGGSRGTYPPF